MLMSERVLCSLYVRRVRILPMEFGDTGSFTWSLYVILYMMLLVLRFGNQQLIAASDLAR